ncbi:pre-rrna processing protein Utp22 [Pseudohyphozyma bogoriensis]|nr:pre-rrna processing protein Utp22 [Pseudohyphozyma bogoriensis]
MPSKRSAAPLATKAKKAKTAAPVKLPSPSLDSDEEFGSEAFDDEDDDEEDEDDEDEFAGVAAHGKGKERAVENDSEEGSEEDEDDSEVNEFEQSDDDDDMIGDDGEDLMQGLDDYSEEDDDDDEEDSDDDGSDEGASAAPAAPALKPLKKANVRNSRAAPALTPAELRALAFAELTASPISTLLSTEVASIVGPLTPPAPATSPLQPLLKSLHAHLTSLSPLKPTSLKTLKKRGEVVPHVEGLDGKWGDMELAWEKPKPEEVRIVGKWAWGGGVKVKGEYFVDMAVSMPSTLLQPKDYMAPRFLIKSTHYLVSLSSRLPGELGPVTLSYAPLPGSQGWALEVRSSPSPSATEKVGLSKTKGAVLRIRVVWPTDAFAHAKLSPTSNISRPTSTTSDTQVDPASLPPTPLRSSSLHFSSLSLLTSHLKFHHTLVSTHSSYASAIRLLQAWATRRSFGASLGFTDEWWAWCVARTLNWGTSSGGGDTAAAGGAAWASWRKSVEWLAGVNWTEGVWFRVEGDKAYPKDDFRKAFAGKPIFVDPTGTVNLAAGIDLATLEMLKQDAQTTIALLLSTIDDERKLDGCFFREIRTSERFDNFVRITIPTTLLASPRPASVSADHSSPFDALVSSLSSTITRALGNRAKAFQLTTPPPLSVAVKGATAEPSTILLTLGLLLDPTQSMRIVDQGPSAEQESACAEFRAFWGSKSELRRFKDGAILESVVWETEQQDGLGPQRNKIVGHILKHILESRHGIPADNVDVFAGAMDHVIVEPEGVRRAIFLEDSVAKAKGFSNVIGAFDVLSKELKDLEGLPLGVSAVQPSSPGLRYSTIFTPSPRRLKQFERFPASTKFIDVHDIILTLEGSGRWPEDLEGVQKIKAAFLSRIAEGLSKLHTIVSAQVVFELDARPIDDNVSLEILTATGYAFRARIYYERSLLLHQEREEQLGLITEGPSATTTPLDVFEERFVHAPRHHAAIATLQHHFISYSPTVRLVKRWFSAQMLLSHFPAELIEIITASVFIDPSSPYEAPNSGPTGFARVMEKLSSWKWRDAPLCVPLYTFSTATTSGRRPAFPTAAGEEAVAAFEGQRRADPGLNEFAWIVATEEDTEGRVWGRKTEKVTAGRVKALAKATLKALDEGVRNGGLQVEQLFATPLDGYSFLIHLDPAVVPRHFQALNPVAKALTSSSSILSGTTPGQFDNDETVRLGWDPVAEFIATIERLYPSVLVLFHAEGSQVIGGIWNPSAESSRPWKIGHGFPCEPVGAGEGKAKVQLNKAVVLKEIERIGKGLVVKTEGQKQ